MRNKIIKKFDVIVFFAIAVIISNSLFPHTVFYSMNNNIISNAQEVNSTNSNDISFAVNYTALSLIPLMIKEMENTNATTIPIKQVINATPSNATALQNIAKSQVSNNVDNSSNNNSNFSSINKTKDLIPLVVNLTKNTNATDIAIEKMIEATPSN